MKELTLKVSNDKAHFKKPVKAQSRFPEVEKRKLAKASQDFESVLTTMMLKSMTKTTGGLFGKDNYGGDVLDVLFETKMAEKITDTKGMGIADKIFKSLTNEELKEFKKEMRNAIPKTSVKETKNKTIITTIKNDLNLNEKALKRLKKFDGYIKEASKKFNVDEKLIKSVILTESSARADAKSKANAKGLMQLIDSTANYLGVENVWDPKENIMGGTKYLSKLLKTFNGDTDLALAGYNAGPGNVKKHKGIPPFKETQNYVQRVKNYLNNLD